MEINGLIKERISGYILQGFQKVGKHRINFLLSSMFVII